jgi:hypothetical protein
MLYERDGWDRRVSAGMRMPESLLRGPYSRTRTVSCERKVSGLRSRMGMGEVHTFPRLGQAVCNSETRGATSYDDVVVCCVEEGFITQYGFGAGDAY